MVSHSLLNPDSSNLIQKLDLCLDPEKLFLEFFQSLKPFYDHLAKADTKQIMITHRKGSEDPFFEGIGKLSRWKVGERTLCQKDFTEFNPQFGGGLLEELWKSIPYEVGRVRAMILLPHTNYSLHKDDGPKLHIAMETNDNCFAVYPNKLPWYQIPVDGFVYLFHTYELHSFVNFGSTSRVHIVFDLAEDYRYEG